MTTSPPSLPTPEDSFLRNLAALRRWCVRRSGNPDLADDIMQETALHALRRMPHLKQPERMRSWLFRIMQRRLADLTRDDPELEPLNFEPIAPLPRGAPDPRTVTLIEKALRRLPVCLRHPVQLHYLEGKPLRDVATSLRTTVNGVKARLYRARRILRKRRVKGLRR
jgi:RNA polymerase sigma-70 factor (ECF subfamily)